MTSATGKGRCAADRRIPAFVTDNPVRRFLAPPTKLVSRFLLGGEVAADLGCGPGFHTLEMARRVGPNGKVYAVDFDRGAIEKLGRKAKRLGCSNVEAHVSSAADIGFVPSSSVDFVLAGGLLCCMADHAGALGEIRRILKPGGSAYLSVTRTFVRRGRMGVDGEEWRRILAGFRVVEEGSGLAGRWAEVALDGKAVEGGRAKQ
ncbi:MAG: class I SAM-dependent methyltransferase [Nitrososphaerota archaeon]|nr:class I SAM-dependent methyltransferase [Nitrososphaerota archaeon]MDG7009606.1 class I SAM-dependent methyltransferase [Nitrososphaerota archaeon]